MVGDPGIPEDVAARFVAFAERRLSGEPLQYIEGTVQFGPLELLIDERALIPRPETERLWEMLVAAVQPQPQVVIDLCTGSGNLALALQHAFPKARVVGVDLSPASIALARENASKTQLETRFVEGDLFAPVPSSMRGIVDLVVSNPPYVASGEMADLPGEIRDHEPIEALEAGLTGLEVLARIAGEVGHWLRPGGMVACEIGETQATACLEMFSEFGPRIENDLAGRPRYVLGRAPERSNVH